jgi:hypothetical protein
MFRWKRNDIKSTDGHSTIVKKESMSWLRDDPIKDIYNVQNIIGDNFFVKGTSLRPKEADSIIVYCTTTIKDYFSSWCVSVWSKGRILISFNTAKNTSQDEVEVIASNFIDRYMSELSKDHANL